MDSNTPSLTRQEWRRVSRDAGYRWLLALLAGLCAYAAWNGVRFVRSQESAALRIGEEEARRLHSLRAEAAALVAAGAERKAQGDPRDAASVGRNAGARYATRTAGPLAALTVGQGDLDPAYVRVSARVPSALTAEGEIANPSHLLVGRFDLAFVVVYLLPLFVLASCYDLLSGEREQGTLALVASHGASLSRFLVRKAVVRASPLVVLVGTVAALAAAWSGAFGQELGIARLVAWILVAAAYVSFWVALALAVDVLGYGSAASAMAAVSAWLLATLVVPAGVSIVADAAHPVPSRLELVHAVRGATNEATAADASALARSLEDHPELAGIAASDLTDATARFVAVQERAEAAAAPLIARFEEQQRLQRRLAGSYAFLTPALLAQDALADVAGTGPVRQLDYVRQVHEFHDAWRAYFLPRILQRRALTPSDYDTLPRFTYAPEPAASALRRAAAPACLLMAATVVMGGLVRLGLRPRRPRRGRSAARLDARAAA